ncbi:MAG: SIMPL domain-containing protein [Bacteroidetes bacterium]|nr:SIMPL domain-containing protein [Bacteroidota bacterium]
MKKALLLLSAVLLFTQTNTAQTTGKQENTIKVVGTAEMEIVPDEIYMSITLREYTKDKKKFTIEELEKNLVNYIEKVATTDKKDIKMDNMNAYILSMKRKNKDEIISKSYDVKFKNAQQVYLVYAAMDSLGITRAAITKYSHSKMDEYKKQIKINAIKAAKEKANYLCEAIGEKAGKAVQITESSGFVSIDDGIHDNNRYRNSMSNSMAQYRVSYMLEEDGKVSGNDETIGDKTIKLSYSIDAEFLIQ